MSARTDLPRVRQVRTRAASRPVSMVFFFIGNPFQNFVISIIYIYILSRFFMKFYLSFGICQRVILIGQEERSLRRLKLLSFVCIFSYSSRPRI